ncbi:unnamed protein product [Prunus armeniaca]|uniref:DNA-directed RNA polymerase n=1 Tax=Prunus armeniaca TaxID=36596 RepID=A0A6J5UBP8_PRUAR|nr:unnamed protein product [Prunus armeniaca]
MLDEDCELLYLCTRPENLLIMNIPVPPTAIRPSVLVDESRTNENDITERLKNIVQANARLRHDLTQDLPPAYAGGFKHSWDALQVEVAQYINSEVCVPLPCKVAIRWVVLCSGSKGSRGVFVGIYLPSGLNILAEVLYHLTLI